MHLKKYCINTSFEEDFILVKELGSGSTSKVYLLEELSSQALYAAKCIKKEYLLTHANGLEHLVQEVLVLFSIDHPCIVSLYYVYETKDCILMIMEYFPKGDLYKRISLKMPISEDDCIKFTINLLETLEFLHSKNIVHRDLKLENIMMTSENNYDFKIIDFGLSYEDCGFRDDKCGSPGYIAPEMFSKSKYNYKIDIFSSGVILYILLLGTHPFGSKNTEEIINKNQLGLYKRFKGNISNLAKEFIASMMTVNPNQRPSASELLNHLWLSSHRRDSVCGVIGLISTSCGL